MSEKQQGVVTCPNCGTEVVRCKTLREWIAMWTTVEPVETVEPEVVKPKRKRKADAAVTESEEENGS